MSDQCLFCGIVDGVIASVRVAEDDDTNAFMDINPAAEGHLHVVPRYADKTKDRLVLPWVVTPGEPDTITALGERLSAPRRPCTTAPGQRSIRSTSSHYVPPCSAAIWF